jgi:hypothetical protein
VNQERTHDEIAELLGVYALDAVDDEERAIVDAHLPTCPRCAAEVADHREVAAQLANTGAPAPEGVWARIVDSLEEQPPSLDIFGAARAAGDRSGSLAGPAPSNVTSLDSRRSFRQWLPLSAAAAVLVVAGLVAGIVVADDGGRSPDSVEIAQPALEDVARRVLNDPGSMKVTLASAEDETLEATAVVAAGGEGYLIGNTLPALDESQTYQLWGVRDGAVISLGILGHAPEVVAFHLDEAITALAVTAEAAGGVEKSAQPAVVVGEIA